MHKKKLIDVSWETKRKFCILWKKFYATVPSFLLHFLNFVEHKTNLQTWF